MTIGQAGVTANVAASILSSVQAAITAYSSSSGGTLPKSIALSQADYNSLQNELVNKLGANVVGSLDVASINGVGITVQP